MQLTELLPREHIIAPLASDTLRAAIAELIDRLANHGVVTEVDAVESGLTGARAREIVTLGHDVVLPHYRSESVTRLVVALGIAPNGLDGRDLGVESRPRIVALILAPVAAATLYLQAVAALAGLLRHQNAAEQLAASTSAAAVLAAIDPSAVRLQPRLTVRDIMIHGVASVTPATAVRDAVDIMIRRRIRALPVVGEKQEVLGIISEWDIMRGLLPQIPRDGQNGAEVGDEMKVKDIMARSVLCIPEDLGLEEAANMMINKDVEQFPVTDEGKLTGFLTRGDIIRKLFGR